MYLQPTAYFVGFFVNSPIICVFRFLYFNIFSSPEAYSFLPSSSVKKQEEACCNGCQVVIIKSSLILCLVDFSLQCNACHRYKGGEFQFQPQVDCLKLAPFLLLTVICVPSSDGNEFEEVFIARPEDFMPSS